MADIVVDSLAESEDRFSFRVTVSEELSSSTHEVTLSRPDYERLARDDEPAGDFVRRCFEFLLEREPKESILSRFDISVIGRYFPEFEDTIK
ncbi:MAG: hypothetical protein ACRDKB_13995 [Actinomycetota bacterium]